MEFKRKKTSVAMCKLLTCIGKDEGMTSGINVIGFGVGKPIYYDTTFNTELVNDDYTYGQQTFLEMKFDKLAIAFYEAMADLLKNGVNDEEVRVFMENNDE
jgi:hypothetical protein